MSGERHGLERPAGASVPAVPSKPLRRLPNGGVKLVKGDGAGPFYERTLTAQPIADNPFGPDGFNVSVEIIGSGRPWQGCGLVLEPGEVAAVVAEMVAWLGTQASAPVQQDDGVTSSEPGREAPNKPDEIRGGR